VLAAVSLLLLALPLAADEGGYHWPLDLPRVLTSSFAEYRPGRFHAGIDLRTGGIGKPVYAARDGQVTRVRCSPWGYGRAIYVTFDDGNSAVYGHLDEYYPELTAFVRAAQHAAKSYTVDLYPNAGQFPVKRGQEIAKSGQTGIGAPHLHYELRDAAGLPIDPTKLGVAWPDTTAPVLHRLLVVPDGPASFLDNDILGVQRELTRGENGVYTCAPVNASGRIGFGLSFTDPGDGGYKLGAREMRVTSGGQEIFVVRHENLSYDNHRNAAVSYHPYFADEGRFLMGYRWPGNVSSSYAHAASEGWFEVPESGADVEMTVSDYQGNTARVVVPVRHQPNLQAVIMDAPSVPAGRMAIDCEGNFLTVTLEFEHATSVVPVLQIEGPTGVFEQQMRRIDMNRFRTGVAPKRSGSYTFRVNLDSVAERERTIEVFARGEGGRADTGGMQIEVPADSPYGMLFASGYESPESRPSPLRQLGRVYRIWPTEAPIDAPITLRFPKPQDDADWSKVHVYRMRGTGWARQDTKANGPWLEITSSDFGTFAAFEDTREPVLSGLVPVNGYQATSRRPAIGGVVADDGSGVQGVEIFLGGQWLLTTYDPERARFDWMRDQELPAGTHTLEFRAIDAAGNSASISQTITIP